MSFRLFPAIAGFLLFLVGNLHSEPAPAAPDLSPLKSLLTAQKSMKSLSAEFTQTRALRTLRSPLKVSGRLWFKAPDLFRWELGDPPRSIVLGTPDALTIIEPGKKRAVRKSHVAPGDSATFGMIRLPGGGSFEEFQKQVQVIALETTGSVAHLEMLPRDARSSERLSAIKLDFDTATGHWIRLEIITREGSSILNEFSNVQLNPKIDQSVFDFDLTGYKITDDAE